MGRGDNNIIIRIIIVIYAVSNQWAVGMEMASAAEVVPAVEMVK